jgi:hypothetical protein
MHHKRSRKFGELSSYLALVEVLKEAKGLYFDLKSMKSNAGRSDFLCGANVD